MFQHEIYFFRGNQFCSHYQVAFILAVFVVYDDDEFSFAEIFDCLFNCIQFDFLHNDIDSLECFFDSFLYVAAILDNGFQILVQAHAIAPDVQPDKQPGRNDDSNQQI